MQSFNRVSGVLFRVALMATVIGVAAPARAFDPKTPSAEASWTDETVVDALREGARAYYAGDKTLALDGLKAAAESGHPAAQWKLGRMYADGDGVEKNDLKAFEYFNRIISEHADDAPTSPQAPYVANAFVEIGSYYMTGIANSDVQANADRAREIFTYAGSYFGDALAQLNLGDMYLDGVGGERDPRQAARWFLLAARKGQIEAQLRLGEMLTGGSEIEPNPVHGLMWLTVALKQAQSAPASSRVSLQEIRDAHEAAFALASESTRRRAEALATQWIEDNQGIYAASAE